ncbi:uncharacterized protein DEA37_0006309 [Paragonimus westermani]|uniref:Kinesin motor domain-containing protein n=1 Tax=Paragonimus westermani TaxID=34504 RepID=A0A5J4NRT0_9TREM|nr:uncharacterized protein DEA37_0006309 [Paragonimus westermani]
MKLFTIIFRELEDAAEECVTVRGNQLLLTDIKDIKCNLIADNRKRRRLFTLDHIFVKRPNSNENELQLEIFDCLGQEAMKSVWEGYNSSLFAYGMTGTGKTYTIFGTKALIEHMNETENTDVQIDQQISILEIYNEKIYDLLVESKKVNERRRLRIREHPDDGLYVEGLTKIPLTSEAKIADVIAQGIANRWVTDTARCNLVVLRCVSKRQSIAS